MWRRVAASLLYRAAYWPSRFQPTVPILHRRQVSSDLAHVLANELRGRNITVNDVAPGPSPTELFLKGETGAQLEEFRKILRSSG
jgi:hypothetical protein